MLHLFALNKRKHNKAEPLIPLSIHLYVGYEAGDYSHKKVDSVEKVAQYSVVEDLTRYIYRYVCST